MKIYLISQTANNDYDTYDSAVVCAPDEETARNMNPSDGELMTAEEWKKRHSSWCASPEQVTVEYIGETNREQGLVLASFNAG